MRNDQKKIRSAVRRDHAEDYLLTSLIAFGVTVIAVRIFLQMTGFPQIGNSVLHIAHALWGGMLLFVAVLGDVLRIFVPQKIAERNHLQKTPQVVIPPRRSCLFQY